MSAEAHIPVIDISAAAHDEQGVARQLADAAADHGFIYIKNTGDFLDVADINGAFDLVSTCL